MDQPTINTKFKDYIE